MSEVHGCNLPDDLYYWPEKHIWVAPNGDGTVVVGVTDVAQNLAHAIISAVPKAAGRSVRKGRSLGTIESGKWVGPVTAPVAGEIVETNPVLGTNPGIINTDPYGEGWFVKMMPSQWEAESAELATGTDGIAAYQAFLEAEEIECE